MDNNKKFAAVTRQERLERAKRLKKAAKKRKPDSLSRRYTAGFTLIIFICFNLLGAILILSVKNYYQATIQDTNRFSAQLTVVMDDLSDESIQLMEKTLKYNSVKDDPKQPKSVKNKASKEMLASIAQFDNQAGRISSDLIDADIVIFDFQGNWVACHHNDGNGDSYPRLSKENENHYYTCPIHKKENKAELDESRELIREIIIHLTSEVDSDSVKGTNVYPITSPVLNPNGDNQFIVARMMGKKDLNHAAVICSVITINDEVFEYLAPIVERFLIAEVVTLFFAAIIVYSTVRRFTMPLHQMSAAARSYAQGDFSPRVTVTRNDELGQLIEAFNQMATDLEQLEASRRNFVANVSHELKTPMTTIGGFVDGILDGTIPPEKQSEYLGIVSSEVKRLSRMVVSMLNLSRIEDGQLDLVFAPVDIKNLLIDSTINFDKQIEQKRLAIRGFDEMKPLMIRADKDMMSQVVYNLIDNAVKFTPKYGIISFSAELNENDRVEVRIRNSGDGIPEEERSRIFERFYKVDKSRSFDKKSSGLGLYIVKSILDLHNGSIRVESKVGKYTDFIFEVPSDISGN